MIRNSLGYRDADVGTSDALGLPWRPIDTAPRDEWVFLRFWDITEEEGRNFLAILPEPYSEDDWWDRSGTDYSEYPTHWLPFPHEGLIA